MTWDSFVVGFAVASAVSLFARWVERRLSRKLDHARVELIVAQEELIAKLIRTVDKAAALLGIEARIGIALPNDIGDAALEEV